MTIRNTSSYTAPTVLICRPAPYFSRQLPKEYALNVTLLAHTQINPALDPSHPLLRGAGTPQEGIIEYAGRVCYRSDGLMGKNPGFISARVREGHEDIVEHIRFVFRVDGAPLDDAILRLVSLPTVHYTNLGDGAWVFSLNARNVRDFWVQLRSDLALEMARQANAVTPSVFVDVVGFEATEVGA